MSAPVPTPAQAALLEELASGALLLATNGGREWWLARDHDNECDEVIREDACMMLRSQWIALIEPQGCVYWVRDDEDQSVADAYEITDAGREALARAEGRI